MVFLKMGRTSDSSSDTVSLTISDLETQARPRPRPIIIITDQDVAWSNQFPDVSAGDFTGETGLNPVLEGFLDCSY